METLAKVGYSIKINDAELEIADQLQDGFRVDFNMKYSAILSKNARNSVKTHKKPEIIKERAKGVYKGSPFEIVHYHNDVLIMRIKDRNVKNFVDILRYLSREVVKCNPICSLTTLYTSKKTGPAGSYETLIVWDKKNPEKTMMSIANNDCFWLKNNEKIIKASPHNGRKLSPYKIDANQTVLIADEKCM